jgi:hypothetical protein
MALKERRLDRFSRLLGWRMLHWVLRCGTASVHWCAADTIDMADTVAALREAVGAGRLAASLRLPCLAAEWSRHRLTTGTPSCPALLFAWRLTGCVPRGAALPRWTRPVPVDARICVAGGVGFVGCVGTCW